MQANDLNPWALKDLYQAIDLIDRKIAHCSTTENLALQEDREADLQKFATKRASLVRSALALTNQGVRCDPQFLPRSFSIPVQEEAGSVTAAAAETPASEEGPTRKKSPRPRQKRS